MQQEQHRARAVWPEGVGQWTITLQPGEFMDNPASTKHELIGPCSFVFTRFVDYGIHISDYRELGIRRRGLGAVPGAELCPDCWLYFEPNELTDGRCPSDFRKHRARTE